MIRIKQQNKTIVLNEENANIEFKKSKGRQYEDYLGDYEINPLITSQVLPTYDKHMIDDLTINMIPTREIDNASGGTTFIIGG